MNPNSCPKPQRNSGRHSAGHTSRLTAPALAAALALGATPALSADVTFLGHDTRWDTPTNWGGNVLPSVGDNARLGNFDVNLWGTASVRSFSGTGALSLFSSLNIAAESSIGRLYVYGGNLTATGAAVVTASMASEWHVGTIGSANNTVLMFFNDGLTFNGASNRQLVWSTMNLSALSAWYDNAQITLNRSTLNNVGTFNDANTGNASLISLSASDTFNNAGIYLKTGAGTSTVGAAFNNFGSLVVNAGTLVLSQGVQYGAVNVANGATLSLGANSSINSLDLTLGTLTGAGTLTVGSASTWAAGALTGTGGTVFNAGLAISGKGLTIDRRSVTLAGASSWSGNGSITLDHGAVLTNNGSFNDQTSGLVSLEGYNGSAFINAGTYTKSGAGRTTVGSAFSNSGTLAVNAGELHLIRGISGSGSASVASGGTLSLGAASSLGRLNLNGGTLYDSAGLIVSDASTWTGGVMYGQGSITFSHGLAISGTTVKTLSQPSLNLAGTSSWSGNGNIAVGNGIVLTNNGSFADQNTGAAILGIYGPAGRFVNAGSYTKSGAGTTTVNTAFTNTGTVTVNAGTLDLAGGLDGFASNTLSGGSYVVSGTGALKFANADIVTNAASITLDGSAARILRSSDGANALASFASIAATGSFTLQGGASFAPVGGFTNAGQLTVGTGSTFSPLSPSGFGPPTFTNLAGATVQMSGGTIDRAMSNAGMLSGYGTLGGTVVNSGTVRASGGTLAISNGLNGKLTIDAGATLSLGASNTVSTFTDAGALALGTRNLSVSADYSNANFGTGNAFNRRAGVTGTGKILATGNVQQTLSGALIQFGNTASAVLALPAIRVGSTPFTTSFSINNAGSSGPSLRGAIQTGGITSARLSGSGVTAQNWGAVAVGGSSGAYTIRYAPSTAGLGLSGQTLAIVNNFDNVAGQTLSISGGKVYAPAVAQLGSGTLDFGIVHVGDTIAARAITVKNAAAPVAGFNDLLLATISSNNSRFTATGSLTGLSAGAQDASSLQIGLDTSYGGLFKGTATLAFASHNTEMSDLALASQQVALKAQVNNYAELGLGKLSGAGSFSGGGTAYTLNFGTLSLGAGTVGTELIVSNTAPGMSDLLGLKFDLGTASSHFSLSGFGPIAGLGAGGYQDGLHVSFGGLLAGHFDEVITLHAVGSNASGYIGSLADVQLHLVGDVAAVPELASWAQFSLGLFGMVGFMGRRRMGHQGGTRARH